VRLGPRRRYRRNSATASLGPNCCSKASVEQQSTGGAASKRVETTYHPALHQGAVPGGAHKTTVLPDVPTFPSQDRDYLAPMARWLLLRTMPRTRLLLGALTLALTSGGMLGPDMVFVAHCAQHGAQHGAGAPNPPSMSMHHATSPAAQAGLLQTQPRLAAHQVESWPALASSDHQCPHCPPAECARALPCAAGPSSQSAPSAGPALASLAVHSLRLLTAVQLAVSVLHAPPTPPPQAAA
jgi:hypothetical protein